MPASVQMGSGMAQLLACLLLLEGIALALQARDQPPGANQLLGAESLQSPFATPSALAQCDFDSPESPFCDWTQPKDDAGEWLRGEGQKPGESPGPPGGSPERREYYIYPEAGGSVQFQSPDLNPAAPEVCVEFLYYMYGLTSKFSVEVQDASGNSTTLWTRTGAQSSAWLLGAVTAQSPVQHPFKVVFAATRLETLPIDVALDTVSVRVGPCSPCVTGCDFDTMDNLCGWENPDAGAVQWEQWSGAGDQPGVGPDDDFSRPGFGSYMLLDSLDPKISGAALLKSPPNQSPGGCLSLRFYYTLHGVSNDTALSVHAAAAGGELGPPLLSRSGEHGPGWNLGEANYTGTADVQFVIRGVYSGKPGLAVDKVQISPCEEVFAQCDFNDNKDPFCGWVQSGEDKEAAWTRTNQTTPTEETGPPGDYPHGEGYYIYAEGGDLRPGQSLRLSSRAFCTDAEACVEFVYYMSGIVEVQTQLRVLAEGPSGAAVPLWTRTGVQSAAWLSGSVTVPYGGPQPSKVVFEVVRGSNPYLDVALDNISVRRGPCAAAAATPKPPASSSAATVTHTAPAATIPPGGPTASRPTTAGHQNSSVPHSTSAGSTAGSPAATSQGFSASTGHVASDTSSPGPTATAQSSHTNTRGQFSSSPEPTGSRRPESPASSTATPAPIPTSTTPSYASPTTSAGHSQPAATSHTSHSPSSASTTASGSATGHASSPTTSSSHTSHASTTHAGPSTSHTSTTGTTSPSATSSASQASTSPGHANSTTTTTRPHTDQASPTTSGPSHPTTAHSSTSLPSPTTTSVATSRSVTTLATTGLSQPSAPSATTTAHASPTTGSSSTGPTYPPSASQATATSSHANSSQASTTPGHTSPPISTLTTLRASSPTTTGSHASLSTSHASTTHTGPSTSHTSTTGTTSPSATSSASQASTSPGHANSTTTTTRPHTDQASPTTIGPSHLTTTHSSTSLPSPTTTSVATSRSVTTLATTGLSQPSAPSATTAAHASPTTGSSSTGPTYPPSAGQATATSSHANSSQASTTPGHTSPPISTLTTLRASSPSTTGSHASSGSTHSTSTVGHSSLASTTATHPSSTTAGATVSSHPSLPPSSQSSPSPGHASTTTASHGRPTSSQISASATTPVIGTSPGHANVTVASRTSLATTTSHTTATSSQTTPVSTERSSTGAPSASVAPTSALAPGTSVAKPTSLPEASTGTSRVPPTLPPDREICTVSGDPHYTTYDGRLFHFMGTCTYLLSAACNATPGLPAFRVEATNEHRGANQQVSYVKSVSVEVYGVRIVLLKGRRVTVDGKRVTLPVSLADGQVSVRLSGTFVLVQTAFGLWVRFDGNHHAEASAPLSYAGQLCGLCGNYNGNASDDDLMPDGTSAGDANKLGESWLVPDAGDLGCVNTGDPGECDKDIAAEVQKPTSCGILTNPQGPFAPCHSKVPPDGAFESCRYDLCGTGGDAGSLCFAVQSYADRCAQAGITIAWRNSSFCPLNCPPGSSYTPCGPACPATCTDPASQNNCSSLPCVEGCVCDKDSILSGDQCVPISQCGCTDSSGQYHPVGESWMGNSNCTQRCRCASLNAITCEEWSCSPVQECRPSEGLLGCQDTGVAACHVAGDPHYFTFDGTMVSFMGTCTYTLVTVCHRDPRLPSFNITAKNEERGQPEASYLRQVTVEVAGATITLQKSRRVLIDGQRVRTPVEGLIPGVSISTSGIYVVLETDFGLVVKFDGNHHLEVQLPGTYFGKVCGMCGNFNNQIQDELLMPDGHLAANASQFGNSWKAPGDADPGCQPDDREDLEPKCATQEMERLRSLCREILASKYEPCHSVIDPQPFLQNCLYDMCEYQGMASVLCDNVQAYVEACQSQGVLGISWRNSTFCPLPCPPHSQYSECSSPCPATCANLYAPAGCQRPTACVEGCACERGYVLSDDLCVPMQSCGCLYNLQYHSPGDSWVTANCHDRCTCLGNGNVTCQPLECLSGSYCALSSSGERYCRPTQFHQCVISGDPHYRTFDTFVHHFQGRATYTLTRTLGELPAALKPFSVAGRNRRRLPFHRFAFLREVYVSVYDYQVTLMQGRKLVVNGVKVTPPYYPRDGLQITQRGRSLFLQTDFGLAVSFDGKDFAEIVLPSTYQDRVGGLCGNYDGQRNNEYMKPDGTWTRSLNTFGDSWQVSGQGAALRLKREAGIHPRGRREEESQEVESGFEQGCSLEQLAYVNGTEACGALSDPQGPFTACHSVVSPSTFQESCVYDLCALFNDSELLCQDYEAYAQLCQEEGIALGPWRQKTGCEMSCPAHTTYKSCMTACPASCANMAAPSDCEAPCVEGCASDPGYILSGLDSVPYNQCGCTSNDEYYQIHDTFLTEDCSQRCTCQNTGALECEQAGCSDGQRCAVANYTRGCFQASPCLSNPCQNEGTCQDASGAIQCLCPEGYVGPFCEETPLDINPTSPSSESQEDNLSAILIGVLVPAGLILVGVAAVCIYRQRSRKKTAALYDMLSAAGPLVAPGASGRRTTNF